MGSENKQRSRRRVGTWRLSSGLRPPTLRGVKALLSGGLVFGLGAAATMAMWTDAVQVAGVFSVSTFGIDLNVDGDWNDVREMTFDASDMYPGAITYASVLVRTTAPSTVGAELTLSGEGGSTPLMGELVYRVVGSAVPGGSSISCDETRFDGAPTYVLGSSAGSVTMSTPVEADSTQWVSAAGADYAAYCFEVTLSTDAPSSVQGGEAEHTWTWDAVSVSREAEL